MKSAKPVSRIGWHAYYVNRFNKTGTSGAEQMACWYLLLHLQLDEDPVLA